MSFNSSLVRLGVWNNLSINYDSKVSIPAWCDWENSTEGNVKVDLMKFQFQLGAIGRPLLAPSYLRITPVSIPAWCDWEVFPFAN